jgi:hypothetical protein
MCACFSAGVLVVVGRRVALLADRVGFRLAHTLAAHWQVVAAAEPARLWATRKASRRTCTPGLRLRLHRWLLGRAGGRVELRGRLARAGYQAL